MDYKEKLKDIINSDTTPFVDIDVFLKYFPELKDEDERIRKELLEHCKNQAKPYIQTGNKCPQIQSWIDWLEKQGEPKLTSKFKPKFKIGDWITDGYNKIRIVSVEDDVYKYSDNYVLGYIKSIDKRYHLWTIQDAKGGDILVTKEDKRPFIFKGFLDKNHPGCPVAYCGIDTENEIFISSGSWWTDEEVEPATEEQSNLLFAKMKEAGYKWDVELFETLRQDS